MEVYIADALEQCYIIHSISPVSSREEGYGFWHIQTRYYGQVLRIHSNAIWLDKCAFHISWVYQNLYML